MAVYSYEFPIRNPVLAVSAFPYMRFPMHVTSNLHATCDLTAELILCPYLLFLLPVPEYMLRYVCEPSAAISGRMLVCAVI